MLPDLGKLLMAAGVILLVVGGLLTLSEVGVSGTAETKTGTVA
jgi:hypothetical protein